MATNKGPTLTKREIEVLRLLASGMADDQIARELGVANSTVQSHVGNIMRKLGAANRVQCGSIAVRLGLIDADNGRE